MQRRQSVLNTAAAVMTGLAVPLLATGPTPALAALVLSLTMFLAAPGREEALKAWIASAKSPLGIGVGVLLVLLLPSVIASIDPGRSVGVWSRVIVLILVAALLYQFLRRSDGARRNTLRALVAASLFFVVIALIGLYLYAPVYTIFRGIVTTDIPTARLLKGYTSAVCCLVPVVVWAGIQLGRHWRYAGLLYVPLSLALILGTNSMAGLVGVIAALTVGASTWFLLRVPGLGRRGLGGFFVGMATIAIAALALVFSHLPVAPPQDQLTGPTYDQPVVASLPLWLVDAHRQQIWSFALHASQSSPLIGHGVDTSNYVPGASTVINQFKQAFIPAHPHNWVLEIFMDTGLLGLAGLIMALTTLVWLWVRSALASALTASCGLALFAAFWTSALFNFSIWLTSWQGVFLLLTVVLLAGRTRQTAPLSEPITSDGPKH